MDSNKEGESERRVCVCVSVDPVLCTQHPSIVPLCYVERLISIRC